MLGRRFHHRAIGAVPTYNERPILAMRQLPGDIDQHLDTLFLCNGARIKRDMRGRDTPFVALGGGAVFGIDVLDIAPVAKLVNGGRVAALFLQLRSEERRVGEECVSKGRYRWSRYN